MSKPKSKVSKANVPFHPVSQKEANELFIQSIPKDDNGGNNPIAQVLAAIERTKETSKSFTVLDVLQNARGFELESGKVVEIFDKWVTHMLALNKISVVEPLVYDNRVVIMV